MRIESPVSRKALATSASSFIEISNLAPSFRRDAKDAKGMREEGGSWQPAAGSWQQIKN